MTFHVKRDARGEWRWNLTASNGKKIATSAEGYKDKAECLQVIALVKAAGEDEVVDEEGVPVVSARSERRQAWLEMTGEDLPHLDGLVPADYPAEELARLRAYYTETEAMRRSILGWMSGTPTIEGWIAPHGWKELREALTRRRPMTCQPPAATADATSSPADASQSQRSKA